MYKAVLTMGFLGLRAVAARESQDLLDQGLNVRLAG